MEAELDGAGSGRMGSGPAGGQPRLACASEARRVGCRPVQRRSAKGGDVVGEEGSDHVGQVVVVSSRLEVICVRPRRGDRASGRNGPSPVAQRRRAVRGGGGGVAAGESGGRQRVTAERLGPVSVEMVPGPLVWVVSDRGRARRAPGSAGPGTAGEKQVDVEAIGLSGTRWTEPGRPASRGSLRGTDPRVEGRRSQREGHTPEARTLLSCVIGGYRRRCSGVRRSGRDGCYLTSVGARRARP